MSQNFIDASSDAFIYSGRIDNSVPGETTFDWPGVYIQTEFEGTSCKVVLQGKCCYDISIDTTKHSVLIVGTRRDTFNIADSLLPGTHSLLIAKRSETNTDVCTFYGLVIDQNCKLIRPHIDRSRRIEFIGDSYTAGFGNEHPSIGCAPEEYDEILFRTTNTNRAFGPVVAKSFRAQYQINAYSGKGLIRNYNGIDKGKEFPVYYDKVLNSRVNNDNNAPLWDFSLWHPQVVVIGLGLNDFLADPPYADPLKFDLAYASLINFLRNKHSGVSIVCCSTWVWPTQAFIPRVKAIVEKENATGRDDVHYFEYFTSNTALLGHPSVEDSMKIARELQQLVAKITKWDFKRIA